MDRMFFACFGFLLLCIPPAVSQEPPVEIHIKLINGTNGKPMKNTVVGLEGSPGYHEIPAQTNDVGIATVTVPKDSKILTHNTKKYVACVDEVGGLIHNDFEVSQILSTGIVEPVAKPNRCGMATSVRIPGELVHFVRPWRFLEDVPF
jgi:hypothetical protein